MRSMASKLDKERSGDRKKLMARESGQVNGCEFRRTGRIIAGEATRSTELERDVAGKRGVNQY